MKAKPVTLTRADLVQAVYENVGLPQKQALNVVEKLFEVIKDANAGGDDVKISSFGNFEVRKKNARAGRNPKTGEAAKITARRVVSFKASNILKDKVNRG